MIPIDDPIKRNKINLVKKLNVPAKLKEKQKVSGLRNDCSLFSRLFISCQIRSGNLEEFFKHENQPYPPSLSQAGQINKGIKADLISCLEELDSSVCATRPTVDVTILDCAAVVHLLQPKYAKTFGDFASEVFLPYLSKQLQSCLRVDVVWDSYSPESLKCQERSKRGTGRRRHVDEANMLPANWNDFLRRDENKEELFKFLSHISVTLDTPDQVVATMGEQVLCKYPKSTENLAPCNHEEADTHCFVHMMDAIEEGQSKFLIRTVDSDVVVLAVAMMQKVKVEEIWVAFGTGKKIQIYSNS